MLQQNISELEFSSRSQSFSCAFATISISNQNSPIALAWYYPPTIRTTLFDQAGHEGYTSKLQARDTCRYYPGML